jgi:phosphatidylcholine synthase
MNGLSAWLVHLYTASGAVIAFLCATAVVAGRYRAAFLWMVVATFDGRRLDDIVDYLTYVFLPMLLLSQAGALPDGWGLAVASAVLLSSAYGFVSADAKTDDHFFTGFPSYWNIVALYVYAAGLSPSINALVLLALSAMVFWRIGYVYPTRTPVLRWLTLTLGAIWGLMIIAMILSLPQVSTGLLVASLFFPVYYAILSFVLHSARRESA